MTYQSFMVRQHGGLEMLELIEKELHLPAEGEAQVRVLAAPVCQDDVAVRVGNRPFLPKMPFYPGYAFLGIVEAVGEEVAGIAVGDRVAGLTGYGSHAEVVYWPADRLVHVPETLDPAEAVTLILNYLVAYQILQRVTKAKPGDKALIIGASGGVGTAFLQLGKLAGLKMYGLASPSKHAALDEYGAIPIDYHTQDFVQVIQQAEPEGLDYVFNGMGEEYFERSLAVLRRGGVLVHYGGPQSFAKFLLLIAKLITYNLLPNGKKIVGYGTHRLGMELFEPDWTALFELLEQGQIEPIVAARFPLLEAREANQLLESGKVTGNVVLLAPELLVGE
ncbi:MAG: medium chain dehydrogenase/reductase family protein [Anaerolineales bacterium]